MGEQDKPQEQEPYTVELLEDGQPVYDFRQPGVRVDITGALKEHPTGMALIKLADGRTVAMNRHAAVMISAPNERGNFTRDEETVGAKLGQVYPDGVPEVTVGEDWLESGTVERVVIASGDGYHLQAPNADQPTPGRNIFDSAADILRDFEADNLR